MAFQFQCPQGHVLQGEESHMGMQTQCPYCGVMFLIPVIDPHAMQASYAPQYAPQQYAPQQPYAPQPETYASYEEVHEPAQPGLRDFLNQVAADEVGDDVPADHVAAAPQGIHFETASAAPGEVGCLHIPCPNGHELETPYDMLGQEVLCPHCSAQFRLRNEDSREFQEKQAKRDAEAAKAWFNWAITAAILIGGGLLVLLGIALSK